MLEKGIGDRFRPTIAVFLVSFILIFLLMERDLNIFDEGIVLVDALRTLNGDIIHRDYYSLYGPVSYYFLAGLFSLSEYRFILGRIYGIGVMAGIVAMTFALLAPRTRRAICLVSTVACGLWMVATPFHLYPVFPCLLLALVGSAILLPPGATVRSLRLFLAGCCTGIAALVRYDGGFFLLVAHLIVIAVLARATAPNGGRWAAAWCRSGFIYCCGTAVVFLPVAVAFLMVAPLSAFIADIFDYPLNHYASARGLPFPSPVAIIRKPSEAGIYFPIFVSLLAAVELFSRSRKRRHSSLPKGERALESEFSFLVMFSTLTPIFYYKGIVSVQTVHMLMSIVPAGILLAVLVDRWWDRQTSRAGATVALVLCLAIIPPLFAAASADWGDRKRTVAGWAVKRISRFVTGRPINDDCSVPNSMAMARLRADYSAVSNYLRHYSRPDERIFVGLDRHDKIFLNSVSLYFSSERLPGTHWHQFDPGIQNRADIQPLIIADLERNRVRWVVRDSSFAEVDLPNDSSRSSGVYLLDKYLATHYRPVARAGKVEVWLAKPVPAPVVPAGAACMPVPVPHAD